MGGMDDSDISEPVDGQAVCTVRFGVEQAVRIQVRSPSQGATPRQRLSDTKRLGD
jgi:hypothetical protein